jgi:hypothetical protein
MREWSSARARMEESLAILVELNDQSGAAEALDVRANTYELEQPECAARIWGGAERLRRLIGSHRFGEGQRSHATRVTRARVASGDDTAFDRAWSDGEAMSLQDISRYALRQSRT